MFMHHLTSLIPWKGHIYNGGVIWNNLPSEIKMAENLNKLKYKYKSTILN